jgi:hypothetical protein
MHSTSTEISSKLKILTYSIKLRVTKPITFHYFPGFILRSAMVNAMAEMYCVKYTPGKEGVGNCDGCSVQNSCIYKALNLSGTSNDDAVQALTIDANHIPIGTKYHTGKMVEFRLTLFGLANSYLLEWLSALQYVGNAMGLGAGSGRFELTSFGVDGRANTPPKQFSAIRLTFSNLHFSKYKPKGDILPFAKLVELITTRADALQATYSQYNEANKKHLPPLDAEILTESFATTTLEYPPNGAKGYACFSGSVVYRGNLEPWLPLLTLGGVVGIGQFTSCGIGLYTISYE